MEVTPTKNRLRGTPVGGQTEPITPTEEFQEVEEEEAVVVAGEEGVLGEPRGGVRKGVKHRELVVGWEGRVGGEGVLGVGLGCRGQGRGRRFWTRHSRRCLGGRLLLVSRAGGIWRLVLE